jgi:epoxyqueuosine reductase
LADVEADRRIRQRAFELGFDVVGVARADEPLGIEHERYRAFIDAGMHGSMQYLADNVEARRRLDTPFILEGARSVVCLGKVYARTVNDEKNDPPFAQTIARYARGQDYHGFVRKKVRKLAAFIRRLGPDVEARPLCDIEPILERTFATRAGLGFVGKNGLVIAPGKGSFMLLGEVVTTLELVPDVPMTERCGSCTRCLDACPTNAFAAPFVLDPRKCISYFTIEDPGAPPAELREAIGEHFFGCDVCQDVCPYNRTSRPLSDPFDGFRPLERWNDMRLSDVATMDEDTFSRQTQGTPLSRPGRGGLARNAVLVAANRLVRRPADPDADEWRLTIQAASTHDDPVAREVARDALDRILEARSAVQSDKPGDVIDVIDTNPQLAVGDVAPMAIDRAKFPLNEPSAYEADPPGVLRVKRAPA